MKQLDCFLSRSVDILGLNLLTLADLNEVKVILEERIECNEKDIARCKPISEKESNLIIQGYNFNVGSALKHIFAFTRTIKKGSRPNKAELKVALRYINKEIERKGINE